MDGASICRQCGSSAQAGTIFCETCGATLRPTVPLIAPAPPQISVKLPTWKRILRGSHRQTKSQSRAIYHLLRLGVLFVLGFGCVRVFRFAIPLLNYIFAAGVLCIPFLALRHLSRLRRVPKVIGFIFLSPVALLSLIMIFSIIASVACDLIPSNDDCLQELGRIEQDGYSVHLMLDDCGGVIDPRILTVEQRMRLLPGLYLFRLVDLFEDPYEGKITAVSANQIHLHIPKGVKGSFWTQEIDRTYTLKRYVYF